MNDKLTKKLATWFESSEEATYNARSLSERDRDYYDNKQWTDEEVKALKERNQPVITINRVKRKVDALKGIEKQLRTDPRAFPRNPNDEQAAQAATYALRYVVDNNNYDQIRSNWWENLCVEGIGPVKVYVIPGAKGFEISIKRIPWDRFFYDVHSREPDFSDAKYMGEVLWMDLEDAEKKWSDKKDILSATMSSDTNSNTYDDAPKIKVWSDSKRKRIRIIQTRWKDEDGWRITTSTKGGVLSDALSPYLDEDEKPDNDIMAVSAFIDRDGNRYGAVREMISPQDEVNKRRSKALHLMSVRQTRVTPGSKAAEDIETLRQEVAKADGIVEASKDEFEILQTGDMAAAQFNLLQESKNEIDSLGVNPELTGKPSGDPSGRAILAKQQAGMVEIAPLLDRKRDLDIRVYRAIWNRIKQFWKEERWIRVTDDERSLEFVGLNRPVTVREQLEKEFGGIPPHLQDDPRLSFPANDNGQSIIDNNVAEMDMDIIIDEGPDIVTLQSEQFEQLANLAAGGVPIPPDVLIEASSLHNKDKLLEKMSGGEDPEAAAQQQQIQNQMIDQQFRMTEAEIEKTEMEALDKRASAQQRVSQP